MALSPPIQNSNFFRLTASCLPSAMYTRSRPPPKSPLTPSIAAGPLHPFIPFRCQQVLHSSSHCLQNRLRCRCSSPPSLSLHHHQCWGRTLFATIVVPLHQSHALANLCIAVAAIARGSQQSSYYVLCDGIACTIFLTTCSHPVLVTVVRPPAIKALTSARKIAAVSRHSSTGTIVPTPQPDLLFVGTIGLHWVGRLRFK